MPVHLYVFAKIPRVAGVKTRLGEELGMARSAAAFGHMLHAVEARLSTVKTAYADLQITYAVAPNHEVRAIAPHLNHPFAAQPQGSGNLGARLARVFDACPDAPVFVMGADIPELSARQVLRAIALLRRHEVVVGPADDGGFWLLGFRRGRQARGIFENVRWSSEHALSDTLGNLRSGTTVAQIASLTDIDTFADYKHLTQKGFTRIGVTGALRRSSAS